MTKSALQSVFCLSFLLGGLLVSVSLPIEAVQAKGITKAQKEAIEKKQQQKKGNESIVKDLSPKQEEALKHLDTQHLQELATLSERLQQENRRIGLELDDERQTATVELSLLWQAAVERSGTLRYAIEKLSRKDAAGQTIHNDGFNKKLLKNIASIGGVAGSLWTGSPVGVLSGSAISQVVNPDEPLARRVSDADMVILTKAIEELQRDLVRHYYDYRYAQERLELARQASLELQQEVERLEESQKGDPALQHPALLSLKERLIDGLKHQERLAEQDLDEKRTRLQLMAGPEAVVALDQPIEAKPEEANAS